MNKLLNFTFLIFIFLVSCGDSNAQFILENKQSHKQFYFNKVNKRRVIISLKSEEEPFVAILDSANAKSLFITNPKVLTHHIEVNLSDVEMIKFKFTHSRKALNTGLDILLGFSGFLLLLDMSDEFTAYLTLISTPAILVSNFKIKRHKFYTSQYNIIYAP